MFWSGIFHYNVTVGGKFNYAYMVRTSATVAEVSMVGSNTVIYYGDNCRVWSWMDERIENDRKAAEQVGLTFEVTSDTRCFNRQ